ncbi:MAG: ABC transporter ATP-binding protein/permease [Clostridium sp.]|nr:ABC transporter ATP-binding protein/permease [Acetatifactor muris]MCM1528020.1 ABC transporter ATP-binding protein/permease [Bacteroides sp.]MCM1563091.1 ABC transporter ATP-binding protein/permease [Clostridium sp.]
MEFSDEIIRQCGSGEEDGTNDLRILWRMLRMMKTGFVKYLLAIISMSVVLSLFDMITALLLKNIIFRVANYAQGNLWAGLWEEVFICVGLGLLMLFIYAVSFYVYTMEAKKGGANLQKLLYSKCMRLPYSYYEQNGSSEFMSKVIYDCERASGIYGSRFRRVLMPFLMMSFYLIAMLMLSWQVTICLFGAGMTLFVINGLFIKPMQRLSREMSATNVSVTERISNILGGMEQIRIFSLKTQMVDQYVTENEKYRKEQNRMNLMSAKLDGLNQLFELLGSLVFIALGIIFVSRGITTVQNLAAVYLLYGSMSWNLLQVGLYIPSMASYLANAKRVLEFLDLAEEPEKYESHSQIRFQGEAEISIRDVTFSYDGMQNVLEQFNLDIPRGKCVALKAESGRGKSTLAKLILGLYPVNAGKIFIRGKAYEDYSLNEARQMIGYVPQEPYLYDVSIAENIRYGQPDADREDIIRAAKLANAHEFITQLENGYETRCGERGNLLSGGQRQRIAIARAILKNAPILILDEATSALDHQSERLVNEALDRLMMGRTTIVIAHRESTLAHADMVVEL